MIKNTLFGKEITFVIIVLFIGLIFLPSICGNAVMNKDSDLISHWKFDETSGNIAHDLASGFHGIVYGATWVPGQIGNALDFDGEDDFVDLPQNAIDSIGNLSEGTIAFWFNYTYNLNQQEIQPLFYMGIDDENDLDNMLIIEVGHKNPANRRLYITWVINGQVILCFDTGFHLEEKRWYHFAAVVGPNGNTGYLDGVELVNRHYNFGTAHDQYFFSDIPVQDQFTMGYGKTADGKCPHFLYYKGLIDDVRIYDTPLSAEEIQEIYNVNNPPEPPSIDGPTQGNVGIVYEWSLVSTDQDGDNVTYYIDWGDVCGGAEWHGPYPSGEEVIVVHKYTYGSTFIVNAMTVDEHGAESNWTYFEVTMPKRTSNHRMYGF